MKSKPALWGIVGWIILESVWIIDLGIDLYTGEMTCKDLIWMLAFCALSAVVIISFLKRWRRKARE